MNEAGHGAGSSSRSLDNVLRILGNPGAFQIIQFTLLAIQYHPLAFNDFMPIFYGLPPHKIRCRNDTGVAEVSSKLTQKEMDSSTTGYRLYGPMHSNTNFSDVCLTGCPHGMEYVYPENQWSIIGDMDLICDKASLVNLASVIYFLGQIAGTPFFGWAADKFGRRITLLLSNLVYASLTAGLIFSRDFLSFAILRFCVGLATQGINSSFYVLIVEWLPPERRRTWGALAEVQYTIGALIIIVVAWHLQNWHHIQIFLAAYSTLAVLLIWFAPESLGWLCLNNRGKEAENYCNSVLKFNRMKLSFDEEKEIQLFVQTEPQTPKSVAVYSFADCFRTPYLRRTTLLSCYIWLAAYVGYLGIPYMSSEIAANIYVNLITNAALEFIPVFAAAGIASRFGNRVPLTLYFLIGGICCTAAGVIPGNTSAEVIAQNVVSFVGRMSLVGTICIIFVYTSELFPTVIRNNGFNMCSITLRVGSMIAPLLPIMSSQAGYKGSGFLLAGLISLVASAASFSLRETKGEPLMETIDDTIHITGKSPMAKLAELASELRNRRKNKTTTPPFSHGIILTELPLQARAPTVPVQGQDPSTFQDSDVDTLPGKKIS
ncbi:organic anion transporter 3-like [Paramacrobiotus metropolitanus]|uniref:organic anion transporter 3-like n=1 Tax=Paramacrobiotus metropolitanus TaxID=2943436 RepID=UPI00244574F2|nr:organic anion transporter 3-like [Paramacrobiotus metropolitanus]